MSPHSDPRKGPIGAFFLVLLASSLAAAGCGAVEKLKQAERPSEDGQTPLVPLPAGDPLESVALLEDARSDGDGLLLMMASKGKPEVRRRAVTALGRLDARAYGAEVTTALVRALRDEDARVRAAAAFALGQRGDEAAASGLLAARTDPDVTVRARVIEAMSRIPAARLWEEVLFALDDPAREVRIEAVAGPQRWAEDGGRTIDSDLVDNALVNVTMRLGLQKGERPIGEEGEDPEVLWRAVQSLQRRARLTQAAGLETFEGARPTFELWSAVPEHTEARLFAVMGLRYLDGTVEHEASLELLREATRAGDWRVVVEALRGLGAHRHPDNVAVMVEAAAHRSAHVRRTALEELGGYLSERELLLPVLERARVDPSSNVRAAALVARSELLTDETAPELQLAALDRDPVVRAGVVRATRFLAPQVAIPLLEKLSRDEQAFVSYAAVDAFGAHLTPNTRARLHELLHGNDNGLRLAAVTALREAPRTEDLTHLRYAFETSRGDIATEVRFNALEVAAEVGGSEALELLELGTQSKEPYVYETAMRLITRLDPTRTPEWKRPTPLRGEVPKVRDRRVVVEVSTNRGRMVFELFPEDAPLHVYNFLTLAERDEYDGLTFHRVVPDFVIQGGDYRGDGNGARSWRGEPLRQEFNPRKYVRGSLGMPRNADLDSGGSQIFVTHRPTPHLDGRYTLFGQLIEGGDVLDAIEVGDVILDVRVRQGA